MYPIEIQLAQVLGAGKAVEGVTWGDIHAMNAAHAEEFAGVDKATAVAALRAASGAAAFAVRALTNEELERAAPISLNADAPLTCQFFVEDHAMRHSFHHLAAIRVTVEAARDATRRTA